MKVDVGGVDRTASVVGPSFRVEHRVGERSIARFQIRDDSNVLDFPKGTPVEVWTPTESGDVKTFGGVIDSATETSHKPGGRLHTIRCADWHYLADKRRAAIAYESQRADEIVTDLHTRYLSDEGVTLGTIDEAVDVPVAVFPYIQVSRALDQLAEFAGFWWHIDADRALHFRARQSLAAPWTVATADLYSDASLTRQAPRYRNRQYVIGMRDKTDPQTETFAGDGERRTFTVGFPIAQVPTVEVNSSAQTLGIRGVDEGVEWYWSKGAREVSQDSSGTRLTSQDVLSVEYVGMFDAVVVSDDQDAITERQTVETVGTGIVEAVLEEPELVGRAAAFDIAARKLAEFAKIGRRLTFTTKRAGLEPGQLATVDLPDFAGEMLVTEVEVFQDGTLDLFRVDAVEGPADVSWTKFFGSLAEQTRVLVFRDNISEDEIITRLFEFDKTWAEAEVPNIFAEFKADGTYTAGDARKPKFRTQDRLSYVEIYDDTSALLLRKLLTSRSGLDTDEVTTVLYVAPQEALGDVGEVAWFGGWMASGSASSGVEVARETLVESKLASEAWQLDRVDTKWSP